MGKKTTTKDIILNILLQQNGRLNPFFVQLPQQIVCDISWANKAEFPGPPLTTTPSFSLFGKFRTSLPNRDPTFATQPIEISSAKYIGRDGEAWKQHRIPSYTALHGCMIAN